MDSFQSSLHMERAWLLAQRNVNIKTITTLVSDFYDFRDEYTANKIILLYYCKLQIDKHQNFTFYLHLMNEF